MNFHIKHMMQHGSVLKKHTLHSGMIITGIFITGILLFAAYMFNRSTLTNEAKLTSSRDPYTKLLEGNARFLNNTPLHPDESKERKKQIAEKQQPFATIITCSDSRLPPEIIFDQGLGDLFVVRTAGNLIGEIELGSIEYSVAHLGVRLIVVLGHQNCGVIQSFVNGAESEGYTSKLISMIKSEEGEKVALKAVGDKVDNCVWANIEHTVKQIKDASPVLLKEVSEAELKIVGAKYHLQRGNVETRIIRTIRKKEIAEEF